MKNRKKILILTLIIILIILLNILCNYDVKNNPLILGIYDFDIYNNNLYVVTSPISNIQKYDMNNNYICTYDAVDSTHAFYITVTPDGMYTYYLNCFYLFDFNGNMLERNQLSDKEWTSYFNNNKKGEFINKDGAQYAIQKFFGYQRIIKIENGKTDVIFNMYLRDYLIKLLIFTPFVIGLLYNIIKNLRKRKELTSGKKKLVIGLILALAIIICIFVSS